MSCLIIFTIILTTFVKMNHFDHLPLLKLNFCFKSFEKVRLFTNELEKTITGMIINEGDEICVATHSRKGEWPINLYMNNPKQLDTFVSLGTPNLGDQFTLDVIYTCIKI